MFVLRHRFCHFRSASSSASLSMDLPDLRGLRNEDDRPCFVKVLVKLFNPLPRFCLMEFVHSLGAFPANYSIACGHVESLRRACVSVHCLQQYGQRLRHPMRAEVVNIPYDVDIPLRRNLLCHRLEPSGPGCTHDMPLLRRHVVCALPVWQKRDVASDI